MSKTVVHLIANAHLDPTWLWNWQAGVDEALATFRSAVVPQTYHLLTLHIEC